MASNGPALLAAAVRAACLAKAPRRTVQAVAAAVASVIVRGATDEAAPNAPPGLPAGPSTLKTGQRGPTAASAPCDASPEELLEALRAAKAARRRKKRERKRATTAALPASRNDAELESAPAAATPLELQQPAAHLPQPELAQEAPPLTPRSHSDCLAILGIEVPSSLSPSASQHSLTSIEGKRQLDAPAVSSSTRPRLNPAPGGLAKPPERRKASRSRQRPQKGAL